MALHPNLQTQSHHPLVWHPQTIRTTHRAGPVYHRDSAAPYSVATTATTTTENGICNAREKAHRSPNSTTQIPNRSYAPRKLKLSGERIRQSRMSSFDASCAWAAKVLGGPPPRERDLYPTRAFGRHCPARREKMESFLQLSLLTGRFPHNLPYLASKRLRAEAELA